MSHVLRAPVAACWAQLAYLKDPELQGLLAGVLCSWVTCHKLLLSGFETHHPVLVASHCTLRIPLLHMGEGHTTWGEGSE